MPKQWTNEVFQHEVTRAATLDASWYLDPAVYELELERIFARTWQAVGRVDALAKPGDFFTSDAAGEPIIVARDQAGQIRAYYNVCPHRAGALARGTGSRKTFQCLYHGWTFNLDGKLLNAPGMNDEIDKSCYGLHEVRVELWGAYIFVNLDPNAPSLHDLWGAEFGRITGIKLDEWTLVERAEYTLNCNWKVYMDNYAEGYHVPFAHPGLSREMSLDDLYVDTYRYFSTQWAPVRAANHGNPSKRLYRNPQPDDQICFHAVFPNFMIDDYPDNLSVNIVKPLSVDKTLLSFEWYFKSDLPAELRETMVKFADEVQYEDIEICEYVQQNLKSRAYQRGRFSSRYENGVHHHQALVAAYVNEQPIPNIIRVQSPKALAALESDPALAETYRAGVMQVFPSASTVEGSPSNAGEAAD
jgi:choline monooxygenase